MNTFKNIYFLSVATLFVVYIFLYISNTLLTDSSAYLYIGSQINLGKVPYLDMFDHKGPLLYFVNAFPFFIGGSWKSIYLIEGCLLTIVTILLFNIFSKLNYQQYKYFLTSIFLISFLLIFNGGNLPETYIFLILSICYLVVFYFVENDQIDAIKNTSLRKIFFWLGFAIGLIALIKISNIAGIIFLTIFFGYQKKGVDNSLLLFSLAGAMMPIIPTIAWLYSNGALDEFINQYFIYNFFYIEDEVLLIRITNLMILIANFFLLPVNFLTIILIGIVGLKEIKIKSDKWILAFFFVLAIDFLSQIISGKGIQHYLLITIPSSIVLIAMLIKNNILKFPERIKTFKSFFIIILIFSSYRITEDLFNFSAYSTINENRKEQIRYLLSNNKPLEKIIIDSSNAWLYLQANKESASKYFTNIALKSNFLNANAEHISMINAEKPQIIISRFCHKNNQENCHRELNNILKKFYTKDEVIGDMEFWQLN